MFQSVVQRLSKFLTGLFAGGAALSMLIVFGIIFFNSVRRYVFGNSLEWGEELPVFIAIYGFMFGAAYAYMQDRHVRFTVLVGFLSSSMTQKLYMLVDLLMAGVSGLLVYSGWQFMLKRGGMEVSAMIGTANHLSEAVGWEWLGWLGHYYPYQAAMIAGGVLLTLASLVKFFGRIADRTWMIDGAGTSSVEE